MKVPTVVYFLFRNRSKFQDKWHYDPENYVRTVVCSIDGFYNEVKVSSSFSAPQQKPRTVKCMDQQITTERETKARMDVNASQL